MVVARQQTVVLEVYHGLVVYQMWLMKAGVQQLSQDQPFLDELYLVLVGILLPGRLSYCLLIVDFTVFQPATCRLD